MKTKNKYRIKETDGKFYPQYKKFFGWGYYKGKPYWDYGALSFISAEKVMFFSELFFDSFEEANIFLNKEKKSNMIIFHNIKEEIILK